MTECHLTRRALFGGSLALAITACAPFGTKPQRSEPPELTTVRRAVAHEESLVARYEAVRRRHPRLASDVEPLVQEHRAHLATLRAQVRPSLVPAASPAPSMSGDTPSARTSPFVPASRGEAVRALAKEERVAADARIHDLDTAPPFLAQLLASIGAAEATHAAWLEGSSE